MTASSHICLSATDLQALARALVRTGSLPLQVQNVSIRCEGGELVCVLHGLQTNRRLLDWLLPDPLTLRLQVERDGPQRIAVALRVTDSAWRYVINPLRCCLRCFRMHPALSWRDGKLRIDVAKAGGRLGPLAGRLQIASCRAPDNEAACMLTFRITEA
ncbi:MAG: hypothetical protein NZ552_09810 [Planctomycetes bacterium]|nr:hypothetical protein [Planctomycetota bacterium]